MATVLRLGRRHLKLVDWNVVNDDPVILRAWDELDAYIDNMVAERDAALTDDLISDLIRAEDDGDRLTHDELLMLAAPADRRHRHHPQPTRRRGAGPHATTPTNGRCWPSIPNSRRRRSRRLMRYCPIVFAAIRTAADDMELGGVNIPAGTLVLANTAAANRDPDVYNDPDRLDITRNRPPAMLTFGGGVHYCLGAHLARRTHRGTERHNPAHAQPRRTGPAPWKP